jgi:hypothetical protein
MTVPNVVKVFMLRASKNALPTKANFVKRKVQEDPFCPIYGSDGEALAILLRLLGKLWNPLRN